LRLAASTGRHRGLQHTDERTGICVHARNIGRADDLMSENSIVLSFSGGGLRAAAFAHGVLTALEASRHLTALCSMTSP